VKVGRVECQFRKEQNESGVEGSGVTHGSGVRAGRVVPFNHRNNGLENLP
jgi:hypothetical protein